MRGLVGLGDEAGIQRRDKDAVRRCQMDYRACVREGGTSDTKHSVRVICCDFDNSEGILGI